MDKSLQDKLLHSFPNTEFIGIIREYDSGRSGSPVFAIKFTLNNKYGLNGTFIVKIGSESWASAEQAFYNHSATDALTPLLARPHMPSLPIEGQVAVAYDVAFGSLIEPQPLMGILDQGNQSEREAQQQIRDFSRTLVDWYLGSDISRNSIVSDPHTLLFRMLTPKRTADMVEKLGKALPFWKPDAPQISVEGLNRRLPNPLAYMQKDTWSKIRYNPISPIGRIHGDLHTGNIMCLSKSKELPKVIDFGQSVPDGVPFFDLAYLEFDIMQHLLSVEQVEGREQWLSLLDFSMVGIVPKQQQMTWNAARAWRFIQPIRQQVKRLQAVDSESYEMVWWLSTVAVGLNFARKGDHTRSPFERMAGLLYAAYGLARILNMLHVKELITEYAAFIPWIQGKFSHPISSHESYSLLPDQKTQTSKVLSVPYRRNPLFTGREKLLKFLQKQLTTKRAAALTQAQAISGLGGIGKTQVAVEYAYRYQQKYQAVLWVTAATRETIITDFVKLAALLHLSERYGANPSIVVAAVKEWLTSHTNWLLILDNVDDLKLVHEFLPTEINGHVLLTTRIQATGSVADAIAVDKMSSAEGILLLLKRAKLLSRNKPASKGDRAIAEAIVEELDGLPLALNQAGAYVEETGCSLSDYLALYRQRRMALLSRRSRSSLDYPHTVASTWSLSFQQVEQADPAAADLLRLCAFLDPDAIHEAIVTEGAKELGPILGPVAADPLLLNEAIQVLRRYSLVKRDPEGKILNLHRLVQVVLKDGLSEAMQQQWAERAMRAVNAVFPEVTHETSTLAQRYLSQVEICASLIEHYHLWFPEAARLLHQAGWYLRGTAQYAQSEHLLQLSLTIYKQTVGAQHPDVADNLNHLALLYHSQGRFAEAEPLYQEAHAIRENVLGPEHVETAKGLNNMGEFYRAQGRYSEAEPLYQRSLAIRENVLGPDARQTAIVIHNLARNSYAQGQYAKAEALYQRALRIYEKRLKPEDPEIAAVLDHLARVYYAQGQYDKAEPLMQRAITIRQEVLGAGHPHFAQSLCGLAKIYFAQGHYAEAEPLMQEALAICEIMHGPKHHSTLLMMESLAELYRLQGRSFEAEQLYPRIRDIYGSLSLSAMIALKEHEPLYQQLLATYEKVPGPDDPEIATVLETYAARLQQAGRMQEAAIFDTRAKAIRAKSVD